MKHIKTFNQINESREKISIGGYEHWVDIEKSVIYGSETAVNGVHFDTDGSTFIFCTKLNPSEKKELLDFIKSKS